MDAIFLNTLWINDSLLDVGIMGLSFNGLIHTYHMHNHISNSNKKDSSWLQSVNNPNSKRSLLLCKLIHINSPVFYALFLVLNYMFLCQFYLPIIGHHHVD